MSGKDRLNTLTYVNNEFGWVDPISGLNTEFPEEPVMVNIRPATWKATYPR